MSNSTNARRAIRWQLLISASALALLASGTAESATDDNTDRPPLWIELGGQFEQLSGEGNPFAPPFVVNTDWSAHNFTSPAAIQTMHIFSFGGEASISFEPSGTDWMFSGAIRFGRSHGRRNVHQQTQGVGTHVSFGTGATKYKALPVNYAETIANQSEQHIILDFQAGKDVGLGILGKDGNSTVGFGIRFAQFTSRSGVVIRARPDDHFVQTSFYGYHFPNAKFHVYFGSAEGAASFKGLGPSISWNAFAPLAGNPQDGEITFDWGVNAALLFGKQRAHAQHHENGHYKTHIFDKYYSTGYQHPGGHDNARSISVPDVGGFAGISYRFADAKLSLGYRADFFFGAMDTGLDAAKKSDVSFNGPYASISVGLGD